MQAVKCMVGPRTNRCTVTCFPVLTRIAINDILNRGRALAQMTCDDRVIDIIRNVMHVDYVSKCDNVQ